MVARFEFSIPDKEALKVVCIEVGCRVLMNKMGKNESEFGRCFQDMIGKLVD